MTQPIICHLSSNDGIDYFVIGAFFIAHLEFQMQAIQLLTRR